jgi:hypothetical protein
MMTLVEGMGEHAGGGDGVGYIKCNEGEFILVNVTEGKKKHTSTYFYVIDICEIEI